MKTRIAVVALLLLALTGCAQQQYDQDTADAKHVAHLAKICRDAGGIYKYSDWDGYHCDFQLETK